MCPREKKDSMKRIPKCNYYLLSSNFHHYNANHCQALCSETGKSNGFTNALKIMSMTGKLRISFGGPSLNPSMGKAGA